MDTGMYMANQMDDLITGGLIMMDTYRVEAYISDLRKKQKRYNDLIRRIYKEKSFDEELLIIDTRGKFTYNLIYKSDLLDRKKRFNQAINRRIERANSDIEYLEKYGYLPKHKLP